MSAPGFVSTCCSAPVERIHDAPLGSRCYRCTECRKTTDLQPEIPLMENTVSIIGNPEPDENTVRFLVSGLESSDARLEAAWRADTPKPGDAHPFVHGRECVAVEISLMPGSSSEAVATATYRPR